jgi:seryl-tRNA synthetase
MAGVSHCFRTEAGSAGRESRGLYRVHQFTKVELFALTRAEDSDAMHEALLAIEEEIVRPLEIPYRVIEVAAGDLGAPAYRKFDLEAWMPGRGEAGDWGEVTSTSNCTDYQARRLKIRYRPKGQKRNQLVHTLNGTALAVPRVLIALLENHQRADGSVAIPEALQPYAGFREIRA